MSIKPTRSLEFSLYAGSVIVPILLTFVGFREPIALSMAAVVVVFEVFRRWRGPQTIQEESASATDFATLNLSKK